MGDVLESTTPGWRPDPSGRYEWRYWDGGWTNRVANSARADEQPDVPVAASSEAEPEPEPAPLPEPGAHPDQGTTDPFAALRTPRSEPESPPAVPAPAVPAPVELAPISTLVPTYQTAHDGSSGTIWDGPYMPPGSEASAESGSGPRTARRGVLGAIPRFFRSFSEQEESYHSPRAGAELPPHPKQSALAPPSNYGRAGLVMLAAVGIVVGAHLPWVSSNIGETKIAFTGHELGHASGFTWAAAAFAVAAFLGARGRVMGWVTMGMSIVVAGLVAMQLLDTHNQIVDLNRGQNTDANVGIGLWIMLASAAIGLVAAFRLDASAEIV